MSGERHFFSDNHAGAHPEVLAAVAEASRGHAMAYGDDPWTERAVELLRAQFGAAAEPFLVFNGSMANVLSLRALCKPWEAVIASDVSHVHVDECGGAEAAGIKLLTVGHEDGRIDPGAIAPLLARRGDQHAVQPRVVSIAQATELGTVYTREELRALCEAAQAQGLLVHVDGSRLANAAVALDASLGELTGELGVDAVSFGGTKNGLLGVEAVVFLDSAHADGFRYLRKRLGQLASKSRFLAAQLVALLEGDLWWRSAAHANAMAARLAAAVEPIAGVAIARPVESNAVFATLPPEHAAPLAQRLGFHVWQGSEVRLMCAWDTTPDDVDAFAAALREALTA